jgi:serine/threonine protein phosphatase PrpC
MTAATLHGLRFEVAGFSEQGPRSENQDAFSIAAFADSGLVALADGMGGEKSGRIAADRALEALLDSAPIRTLDGARRAVRDADDRVVRTAESDPERYGGMGCALGLLSLTAEGDGPGWIAAHVGDVRILSRSPDGVLRLETRDHTPAFSRWEAGEISLDEIPDSAGANRLQRAVGRGGEADVAWFPAAPGWSWLLVSDGVYKAMRLDELANAMAAATPAEACETIRRKVDERGPDDNFTAVLVRAAGDPTTAGTVREENPSMTNTRQAAPRRSAWAGVAAALALLALVVAGLAFYTAMETGAEAAERGEVERLRMEVDSLRSLVSELLDPFAATDPPPAASAPVPQPTQPAQ